MKLKRNDWLAILFLCLLPLFYFAPAVFGGQTFYLHDISIDYTPLNIFNTQTLLKGELPLWNPYLDGGFPFAAQTESAPLYPLNLILLLPLPLTTTNTWYIVVHYALAGVFTYLLSRFALRLKSAPALVAGLIFAFNGSMIAQLTNFTLVATLAWMPLVLLLYILALDKAKIIYVVAASLAMSAQLSKSHPQIALYTAGILALYALFAVIVNFRKGKGTYSLRPLWILSAVFAISAGFSAYLLLYAFELIQRSNRSEGVTYQVMTFLSYPPDYLIKFFIPNFWGSFKNYVGRGNYPEMHAYVGILPLLLLPFAWFKAKDWRVWFFGSLAFISLLLSFGKYTPLYNPLPYVPLFNYFRVPARWLLLLAFSLAILAAYGLQSLGETRGAWPLLKRRWAMGAVVVVALLVIGGALALWNADSLFSQPDVYAKYNSLAAQQPEARDYEIVVSAAGDEAEEAAFQQRVKRAYADMRQSTGLFLLMLLLGVSLVLLKQNGWLSGSLFYLAAALIILGDLLTYGGLTLNPYTDASYFLKTPDTVRFLKQTETAEAYRIFPTIRRVPYPHNLHTVLDTLHFNIPSLYGIESIEGEATLPLKRHTDYMMRAVGQQGGLQMLSVANVKYVITEWDLSDTPDLQLVFVGKNQKIYQNTQVLPRAFALYQVEALNDRTAILDRLADSSFNPETTVILEKPPAQPLPPLEPAAPSTVTFIRRKHNKALIEVDMADTGFLFLSDVFYPGWKAYIDGQPAEIYRANYLFRAVQVEAGRHLVEFSYEPLSFKLGVGLTCLTLIIVAAGMIWEQKRSAVT